MAPSSSMPASASRRRFRRTRSCGSYGDDRHRSSGARLACRADPGRDASDPERWDHASVRYQPFVLRGGGMTATQSPPLAAAELDLIDAWWRAANYLSVGQIYLLANPLLGDGLRPEDVKPRLLGHWGTTPGLNLLYAHLNRVIRAWDLDMIFLAGPGHGGPAVVANVWL